jgi:hypothetical protein
MDGCERRESVGNSFVACPCSGVCTQDANSGNAKRHTSSNALPRIDDNNEVPTQTGSRHASDQHETAAPHHEFVHAPGTHSIVSLVAASLRYRSRIRQCHGAHGTSIGSTLLSGRARITISCGVVGRVGVGLHVIASTVKVE